MELIFCGKRVARTVFVLQKYSHISVILWGYVLIWYACGDGSIDVKGRRQIAAKALDFRYFSAPDSFERVERVIVCGNLSKGKSAQKV